VKLYYNEHVMKDEMGGTCSTSGREKQRVQDFGREAQGDHAEDLGVHGKIILEWILEK